MNGLKWKNSWILLFVTSDQIPKGRMNVTLDYFQLFLFCGTTKATA